MLTFEKWADFLLSHTGSIPNPKISYKPFWIEVMLLIPYLNFATLDYGLVELISSIVSVSSFTESDKTKPL
jgi:hypothetical protein